MKLTDYLRKPRKSPPIIQGYSDQALSFIGSQATSRHISKVTETDFHIKVPVKHSPFWETERFKVKQQTSVSKLGDLSDKLNSSLNKINRSINRDDNIAAYSSIMSTLLIAVIQAIKMIVNQAGDTTKDSYKTFNIAMDVLSIITPAVVAALSAVVKHNRDSALKVRTEITESIETLDKEINTLRLS